MQRERVTEFEVGWLVGFLEGEGSVNLVINSRKNRTQTLRVIPKVVWTNSDKAMIDKANDILYRLGVDSTTTTVNPRNNPKGLVKTASKVMYYINVWGIDRLIVLLGQIDGRVVGEKSERITRLHRFIKRRRDLAGRLQMQNNFRYDKVDIDLMLDFLKLTRCRNFDKIARMLEDYTADSRYDNRELGIRPPALNERICSVPGCFRRHYALGYCSRHWQQYRAGNVMPIPPQRSRTKCS